MSTAIKSATEAVGKSSKKVSKTTKKAAQSSATTGLQPFADRGGWILCTGDRVNLVPNGDPHRAYTWTTGTICYFHSGGVACDVQPEGKAQLLPSGVACQDLRWEMPAVLHHPTAPKQLVRVVVGDMGRASEELKSFDGQLAWVESLEYIKEGLSLVTVKFKDAAFEPWPATINSTDLLVVPTPVVHYVPEPERAAPVAKSDALASVLMATQAPAADVQRAGRRQEPVAPFAIAGQAAHETAQVPALPPPIEEESDLPFLNREATVADDVTPAAWLRPCAADKAHYFAAGQKDSLCVNWMVGPHERNPADAAGLKHCAKCVKILRLQPNESPAPVATEQPAYQAPKIVATVPRNGTNGPFEWNEYGVCSNPNYAYQAEKGKREFVKITTAQTPDGDWVTGHDFAASDSGSSSPTSLAGERFATVGLAATAGARNILSRSTANDLSPSLRKGLETLLSVANEAVQVEPVQDVRLTTSAWDLLEIIVETGGYLMQDSSLMGGEIMELRDAGLIALDTVANGTTYRATKGGAAFIEVQEEVALPVPVAAAQPAAFVQEIALADIDTSRNYRQVFDEADLAELATSIKAHGVMQPVLVRPSHAGPAAKPYQLVYGGRRYKASALAGLATIPATVRELSDLAFAEMQLVENVQRKDVRPSDEARAFHDLLTKHNKTPEELSHQVGRPVKFVLQRAKLVTLAPFWMNALEQERLPLVAAHELARLPEAGQSLLEEAAQRSYDLKRADAVFTVQWVRSGISQWVLADLNAAFFRKNDATLFPKAGACTTCPKRSGACQGLFDEVELKHDYCLDKPCFEQKKTNLVERHKEELRKQTGKKAVLISSNYYQVPAGVFDCYRYKEAKQEDPDAVQAVMIDGTEMGRIKWVVLKAQASTGSSKDKEADAIRIRKERLTKTHRALIAEKLTADLPAAVATQGPVYESILTWLLLEECGSSKSTLAYLGDSWGWEPSEADIRNDYNDKDEHGFRPWHRFVLRMIGPLSLKQRMELYLALKVRHRMDYDYEDRQFTIAKLVNGLGYPELEAEAEQAIVARYYTKKTKGAKA